MYVLAIEKPAHLNEEKVYFVKERLFGFPEWTAKKQQATQFQSWQDAWDFRDTLAFNFVPEVINAC